MYRGTVSYSDGKERLLQSLPRVLTILFEIFLFTERRDSILSRFFASWWYGDFLSLILAMFYSIFVFLWLTELCVMLCCSDV